MNRGGEIESAGCHKDFNYGFNCVIKKSKSCTSVVCQTNNMNLPIVSLHIPTCSLLTPCFVMFQLQMLSAGYGKNGFKHLMFIEENVRN